MTLQHGDLNICSEHELKVGIKSVIISTFWNHKLVMFLNRDANCGLVNVALAVPSTNPMHNSLFLSKLIGLGFFLAKKISLLY